MNRLAPFVMLAIATLGPLAVVLGAGCGPTPYERCLDEADAEAEARFDRECPTVSFDDCPSAPDIVDDLQRAQERCPP